MGNLGLEREELLEKSKKNELNDIAEIKKLHLKSVEVKNILLA